jgi:hypothetical protein
MGDRDRLERLIGIAGMLMRIIETFYGPLSRPYHVRRLDAL